MQKGLRLWTTEENFHFLSPKIPSKWKMPFQIAKLELPFSPFELRQIEKRKVDRFCALVCSSDWMGTTLGVYNDGQ